MDFPTQSTQPPDPVPATIRPPREPLDDRARTLLDNPEVQVLLPTTSRDFPHIVNRLAAAWFTNVEVATGERGDVAPGTVFDTEPGANTSLSARDVVTVLVAVPDPAQTTTPVPTTTAPAPPAPTAPSTAPSTVPVPTVQPGG